jgi:hypothetical protein
MPSKFWLALAGSVALVACNQQSHNDAGASADAAAPEPPDSAKGPSPAPAARTAAPAPQATPSAGASTPTISLAEGATTVTVTPAPTPCGAEKLSNYVNLIPTSTAKEEIARTLGHARVRYVPLKPAPAVTEANRVTAQLGVDGRIKKFTCG